MIEAGEARRQLLKSKSYIFSYNANPKFVLVDTCAFQFEKGLEIIDNAKKSNYYKFYYERNEQSSGQKNTKKTKK